MMAVMVKQKEKDKGCMHLWVFLMTAASCHFVVGLKPCYAYIKANLQQNHCNNNMTRKGLCKALLSVHEPYPNTAVVEILLPEIQVNFLQAERNFFYGIF